MDDSYDPSDHPVLTLARDEAVALGHSYIGTEHVLLGLMRAGDPEVNGAIRTLGLDRTALRTAVLNKVHAGSPVGSAPVPYPYTTRAQRVIRLAWLFSEQKESLSPTPLDFLEALLAEKENIAAAVLAEAVAAQNGVRIGAGRNWRRVVAAEFQRAGLSWE